MADEKDIKKTPAKAESEKDDKVSPEEKKRKKEEVLARIDAEIGESESSDEVVIDEKTDEQITKDEEPLESKESFEKEMIEEEVKSEEKADENQEIDEKEEEKSDEKEKEEEMGDKKTEDDSRSTFSAAEFGLADRKSNKGKNILLFVIVFLLVAIVSALFYFFFTGALKFEQKEKEQEIEPTQAPTATPTPVEFDRAQLSVQVLNGSGVSGAAGEMETFLEDVGYENIEIGNADNSDYQDITIQIKEEFEEFAEFISKDLSKDYTVNEDYEILEEDSEYDVVIIVGLEEDSEDTTTAEE